MAVRTRKEAFSNPLLSPPYLEPPYPVEEAKLIIVRYRADPKIVAGVVPQPLEPVGDGIVTAFIGDIWQIAGPGEYHEGGISVGVRYEGTAGSYMPFRLTSTYDALLVGREVFGMPKLLCDRGTVWIDGNGRRASLVRRGDEILALGVNLERRGDGKKLLPVHRFFIKKIPSPDPKWASLRQVVYQRLTGHQVKRAYTGRGWVRTGGNVALDLSVIAPSSVVEAWYVEAGWDVPAAKILLEEKVWRAFNSKGPRGEG
ncbi:MAG: acetoacetate decarboxylase family protein [Betaproteobacteria bacterium]|nr:acetoacetate decarboxylase family protein [Betaproteobacteria bacterium]